MILEAISAGAMTRTAGGWIFWLPKPAGNRLNMGQNGREIPSAAPAFPADTDLLIVMLGTNDLLQGRSPEQAAELERFFSGISLDRSKILLIAPPPVTLGAWVPNQQLIDDSHALPGSARPLAERMGIRFADAGKWDIPWPMTAYTLRSRATKPLLPDFWRNSNETNHSPFCFALLLLTGCGGNAADGSYQQITQEEAKEMMDTQGGHHPGCAGAGRVRQRPHSRRCPAAGGYH